MIRIAISLSAYEAIAASLPKGHEARPPERLKASKDVGVWIDLATHAALDRERRDGEGYSEVILRLVEVDATVRTAKPTKRQLLSKPADLAVKVKERQLLSKRRTRAKPKRV